MSKKNRQAAAKAEHTATDAPAPVAAATVVPKTIKVLKANANFRGARQAWYEVLVAHDGMSANDYVAHCKASPPSVPKSGVAESPAGWLGWFKRQGVVELV